MTKLSVNVNKLATLRNARGKNNPDVVQTTLDIIAYGAQGITVHPRPDERHIRKSDVIALKKAISVEFNIEGYPDASFLELVKDIKPTQCTLVPDAPHVLTSNAGWEVASHIALLQNAVAELQAHGIRVALFIDPNHFSEEDYALLPTTGADRVELYTEAYANAYNTPDFSSVLARYKNAASRIHAKGIGLNAGHDLDLHNLRALITEIPAIEEVSIGHALICDSLRYGLQETIARYLQALRPS